MRTLALQILLAIAVFAGGYACGHHGAQVAQVKAEVKADHVVAQENAGGVQKAQTQSVKTETKVAAIATNVDTNKAAIARRVTASIKRQAPAVTTEKHDETTSAEVGCAFYLDTGTVRMLNASRQGAAFHSASSGDEALDAAPALCFTDFIDADQDLTKLYLDLAARHDALVESVEEFQAGQRKRLGIKESTDASRE
ncbi:hypothetical protein SB778_03490 [Paraburkholderia sp. SIMBA_050]